MTNKLKTIPAAIFALFLFSVSTLACTCVYIPVKAKQSFSGQVFAIMPNEKSPDPKNIVPQAAVKLWVHTDEKNTVVAQNIADENGRFVLENVKPGNYVLQVSSPPSRRLGDIYVRIKISPGSSLGKREIIFGLAPVLACCEGYVKAQKATRKNS